MDEERVSLAERANVDVADDNCCTACQNGIFHFE